MRVIFLIMALCLLNPLFGGNGLFNLCQTTELVAPCAKKAERESYYFD